MTLPSSPAAAGNATVASLATPTTTSLKKRSTTATVIGLPEEVIAASSSSLSSSDANMMTSTPQHCSPATETSTSALPLPPNEQQKQQQQQQQHPDARPPVVVPPKAQLPVWLRKLITKEDRLHVHKSLGLLVLASFLFRLAHIGDGDMAFDKYPSWTIPTLLLHLFLNVSAFEFRIPSRRIDSGYRIWPEYRFHSLVFVCRSVATMLVTHIERHAAPSAPLPPQYLWNAVIVMTTMAAADAGSWYFGETQSGFSRQLRVPNAVRYFFSAMQMYATAGCLYGMRRQSIQFIFVLIIQGNAFLMTLRRKNLAGHATLVALYGAALLIGMVVCILEFHHVTARKITGSIGSIAILVRLSPPLPSYARWLQNKYIMWIGLAYLLHRLRPLVEDNGSYAHEALWTDTQLSFVRYSTLVLVMVLGWYQSMYGYQHYQRKKSPLRSLSSSSSTSSSVSDSNNNKSASQGNNVHVDSYVKNR